MYIYLIYIYTYIYLYLFGVRIALFKGSLAETSGALFGSLVPNLFTPTVFVPTSMRFLRDTYKYLFIYM